MGRLLWVNIQGKGDKMQNIDSDGYINIDYYITAINDIISRTLKERGQDQKPDTNNINACLRVAYNDLFRPEVIRADRPRCNIPYNTENISRMIEIYISIAGIYNALPSINAFERLFGAGFETIEQYVTGARTLILKARKSYIQDRLNNTPIGVMTLANNDIETGLLYTRQNIVTQEAVKKSLSFDDLKRIATDNGTG